MTRREFTRKTKARAKPGEARAWLEWSLVQDADECLLWPYAKSTRRARGGYGKVNTKDGIRDVHRYACERAHGEPPSPLHEAAHSCGNRLCVNKRHLRWATPKDNKADELIHGTRNRGERQGMAKLNAEQVIAIRSSPRKASALATELNVSEANIRAIRARKTWAWLDAA